MIDSILDPIFIFVSTALLSAASIKMLHMYQLSSYRLHGVMNWLKVSHYEYFLRYFAFAFFASGIAVLFNLCFVYVPQIHYFSFLFYVFFGAIFIIVSFRTKSKVPMAVTPRMTRLILVNTLLCLAFSVGGWGLSKTPMQEVGYCVLPLLIPLICLISYGITYPFEKLIARSFIKDATAEIDKRKASGMEVIGITGSYGKTTAKNILAAMLATKYRVCATPGSYNTPLGICRTVNDVLGDDDRIFIAEMGARRRGDIKELCALAKPDYALITGVGTQHLETFGSVEAIADAKFELAEALPSGAPCVFNCSDAGAAKLSERFDGNKVKAGESEDCAVRYYDVTYDASGCTFKITDGKETIIAKTRLLGRHIPGIIASCAAVAMPLGVPLCACVRAAEKLSPVPHRLEVSTVGDKTIIDDAYNSNTEGAKNALEVLSAFEGEKIIVTPGIVELGDMEKEANITFGRQIAEVCDKAVLVGSRAKFMAKGASEAGMTEGVYSVDSLKEAKKILSQTEGKAAILFENDLPDNYK